MKMFRFQASANAKAPTTFGRGVHLFAQSTLIDGRSVSVHGCMMCWLHVYILCFLIVFVSVLFGVPIVV